MIYVSGFGGSGPTDSDTVLLLGFEGTDGATTTSDESYAANGSPTFHNQAQIDTAQSKFGNSSLLLDGSDKIVFADDADWDLGAAWTVEGFFRSADVSGFQTLYGRADTGGVGPFMIDAIGGTILRFRMDLVSEGMVNDQYGVSYSAGTWYHFAMARSGNDTRHYFDGNYLGKRTSTNANAANTSILTIGSLTDTGSNVTNGFNGWLDEFRISTVARYTSETTYTVPSAPFTR